MLLSLLSKGIGFLRDIILAYFYGASSISDAFLISLVIPSVIFGFIGIGVSSAYIPMYSNIESKLGVKEGDKFTNYLINLMLVFTTFLCLICLLFTEPLVKIFASGFDGETIELATSFTRVTVLSMYFSGLIYIFSGYLQIKGNHIAPSLMGLPLNFALILAIVLSSYIQISILPFGKVLGAFLQFLFLLFFVYQKDFSYKPILNVKNDHLKRMVVLAFPIILGSSVEQINKLVDRTIASNIAIGGISALNYANQLNLFVQGIFVSSIAAVFYPVISKMAANDNVLGLRKALSQTMVVISVLLVPVTMGSVIFAQPIVELLFGRGAFTKQAIDMTSTALFYYSIGMIAFGLRDVLTKAFYSLKDSRTPMINSALTVILNIVLNIVLSKFLGIGGLALATSISASVCTILLFISLGKKIGFFEFKNMTMSFLKIICSSVIMGFIAKFSYVMLGQIFHIQLSLLISILVGAIAYCLIMYFMKIKEVDDFIKGIKRVIEKSL